MRSKSEQQDIQSVLQEAETLLGASDIFCGDDIFFPTRKRTTRLRIKSLKAILPTLKSALHPGEQVHFISVQGFTFYWWEQLFGAGAWAPVLNSTTVVLTDSRLLVFNVKHRSRIPKDMKNAIPLSEMISIRRVMGLLIFRLQDSRKLRLGGLRLADAKALRLRLQPHLSPTQQVSEGMVSSRSIQPLCPSCCRPINNVDALQCPSCRIEFHSGQTAALRSLLLAGLGDIYLKHKVLGVLELLVGVLVWLNLFSALTSRETDEITVAVVFLVLVNGIDYFVTKGMASKGIIAK